MAFDSSIIVNLIRMIRQKVQLEEKKNVERFVKILLEQNNYNKIKDFPIEIIETLVFDAWQFFQHRNLNEAKCEIYEIKLDVQPHSSRIIINLLNDNMPFLLDSFISFLERIGLRAHILIHPHLKVQRDSNGRLKEIQPIIDNRCILESLIHCEIIDPVSLEMLSLLKTKLPRILKDIRLTNRDLPIMRFKIREASEDIRPVMGIISSIQAAENKEFLTWLNNEHFTFLGYRQYDFNSDQKLFKSEPCNSQALGILSDSANHDIGLFHHGAPFNTETMPFILHPETILITKTTHISNVHRPVPMDSISIKKLDDNGNIIGIQEFIGIFTSLAYSSCARDIPLLRRKISHVMKKSGFSNLSHDEKTLTHIMDSLPRDELFQASEEELLEMGIKILSIQEQPQLALLIRPDYFCRFLSCLVYIPRNRFHYELMEVMGNILAQELHYSITFGKAQYEDLNFVCAHYIANISSSPLPLNYQVRDIEEKLAKVTRSWKDNLQSALNKKFGEWEGAKLYQEYSQAFSKEYQEKVDEQTAVIDIKYIEKAYQDKQAQLRIYRPDGVLPHILKIKLYNPGTGVPLSELSSTFENMDLNIERENSTFVINSSQISPVWIHDFEATSRGNYPIDIRQIEEKFLIMFSRVWNKDIENDGFNRLVIRAGLDWQQCSMLRAYAKYLRQLQISFSQTYIEETLVKNLKITYLIVQAFMKRFHPLKLPKDQTSLQEKIQEIYLQLEKVENSQEDRILRRFINLVTSTIRTNYFQLQANGKPKAYLTFKFDCKAFEELPAPRPLYEIYVYSPRFEAVHLRGGKVARGGIRWSDRKEDFRTEVLGLLKAQMVKNAIIVPKGSKGGFIIKKPIENLTREEISLEGIECYKLMMQALLEITDNIGKDVITPPPHTVLYDQDDPYLVVAADKGTATFSDYANVISKNFGFWLDDAFASGGSAGYDHKGMAITARGAWESVKRHFWEMGVNLSTNEISVVGVGDMSGDVFGNGLLQSPLIRLIAAFNHRHIFIDPYPNPATSFNERKRLFEAQLGWDAYNQKLMSSGGRIFTRDTKIIHISPEIKQVLSLHKWEITPNELIQAILMAQVDLIWFGGIGTYIKSRIENHADVSDPSNDNIRVNANDLRCKVIAEGANLGVTQRARIDFARAGGRINTDAIDNSGGVDCSDHEVNIKILLRQIVLKGKLTLKARDMLLHKMTEEVASLVLKNNYDQNLSLSMASTLSVRMLDRHIKRLHFLEKTAGLDRSLEYLPDDIQLADYQSKGLGLVRPQLAVLMPYAKNALGNSILYSGLPDEEFLIHEAHYYFPKPLQDKYASFIETHPLKREIIATMVSNKIINRMGPSFVHELVEKTKKPIEDIIRAYFMVLEIFKIEEIWHDIESLKTPMSAKSQLQTFQNLQQFIYKTTRWFLKQFPSPLNMQMISTKFTKNIEKLSYNLEASLPKNKLKFLEKEILRYQKLGLGRDRSARIAKLEIMASSPDIILIAEKNRASIASIANLYFTVGRRFKFDFLQKLDKKLKLNNSWEQVAINALSEDLEASQSALTTKILYHHLTHSPLKLLKGEAMIRAWTRANPDLTTSIDQLFKEGKATLAPNLGLLTVLQRELRILSS
ncbi:MAG: NAD-glutamate dehydrogenase [Alphaproteobacteria bacterium]|nr:NAD-glutamate dehydrogenase [Alphaproteobacteria bacterium]